MKLSQRTASVEPSATLAMTARAKGMKARGIDVLAMSAGEPDFDTPENIKAAARAAIAAGDTKYTAVPGTPALRQAAAAWAERLYGHRFAPAKVIVGTGGKQVLFNAICCLLDPGDEALFASPYWVSYPDMIRFAGGKPVPVAAGEREGFLPQADAIARAITPKTRLLILNSPSNPTGATYSEAELTAIAAVLREHPDVAIISDDIYSGLVYDGPFVGLAQVAPDLHDRTLIATGVSKTYAMTGWRIGIGIGPEALVNAMSDLQGACTSSPCSIAQAAAVEALTGDQTPVEAMRAVFKGRRDRIVAGLRAIPGLEVFAPKGAFYVFPRVTRVLGGKAKDTAALCEHLLEHAHLALVPGSAFGSGHHIRLSFACSDADIDEALARLKAGLASLR
jgi:aspartate aminotransferase